MLHMQTTKQYQVQVNETFKVEEFMAETFNTFQHVFLTAHSESINDNSEETSKSMMFHILVPGCPEPLLE